MSSASTFYWRFLFLILGSLFSLSSLAQVQPVFNATVDKRKIVLGEQMQLTIEMKLPAGTSIPFIRIDSIPHFEIVGEPNIDTTANQDAVTIRGVYTLTSFDSGHWVIPAFSISRDLRTDTIPVDVVFSDFDPEKEYHDIKDIIEVKLKKKEQWWWFLLGGLAVLGALILYLMRRKKPVRIEKTVTAADPYATAMKSLEKIHQNKPATRLYYTELVDIFRQYVLRRKKIHSLQKTTDDLILQLRDVGMDKDQYSSLAQTLRLSDFVKFAKYIPGNADDEVSFKVIRNAIITIEQSVKQEIVERNK